MTDHMTKPADTARGRLEAAAKRYAVAKAAMDHHPGPWKGDVADGLVGEWKDAQEDLKRAAISYEKETTDA